MSFSTWLWGARGGAGLRNLLRFMYVSIWRHLDNPIKSGWFRKFLLPTVVMLRNQWCRKNALVSSLFRMHNAIHINHDHNIPEYIQCKDLYFSTFEPWHDKTSKVSVRPAKTQISLGIRSVWSGSSLSAWRKFGSLATHWAHSEDSDQTGRMPRLIWVFSGRTLILLVLSCRGSFDANFSRSCVVHNSNRLKNQQQLNSSFVVTP